MMNRNFSLVGKLLAGWRRWPVLAVGTLVLLAADLLPEREPLGGGAAGCSGGQVYRFQGMRAVP